VAAVCVAGAFIDVEAFIVVEAFVVAVSVVSAVSAVSAVLAALIVSTVGVVGNSLKKYAYLMLEKMPLHDVPQGHFFFSREESITFLSGIS
jgi:hypothetical protein